MQHHVAHSYEAPFYEEHLFVAYILDNPNSLIAANPEQPAFKI